MLSQAKIRPDTPMGANLVEGGATFRVWAPRARSVNLVGIFGGETLVGSSDASALVRHDDGTWTGFVPGATDGDVYRFMVVGEGSVGTKRDPYAREMATDGNFPACGCVLRGTDYPWHDGAFATPDFSDMVVYQLHVGTYLASAGRYSTLLDVAGHVDYLASLGINVLQPLPIDEVETATSLGYNGSDYFSPDMPLVAEAPAELARHLARLNALLVAKGLAPDLTPRDLDGGTRQMKALVDICHVYGIALVFDVVYNHAGGFEGDDHSLFFWDRAVAHDNNDSLYFTDKGCAGGLSFALWNAPVRQFLIDNALYFLRECHVDGFRYDEISALVEMNGGSGSSFCRDLTSTVRYAKPRAIQNAEFWPVDGDIVRASGAGFDVTQHDGLRQAVRGAIAQAASGAGARIDMDALGRALWPHAVDQPWQAVTCIENHDIVKAGEGPRIAALADGVDARSWYARSRARVASGLLLTAPGIPQIFMGQEFLEFKQWSDDPKSPHLIDWAGLAGGDKPMVDHLRFMQEMIRLRRRLDALRGPQLRVSHVHDDNRVLVFHRWLEGRGADVLVVASLNEQPYFGYQVGFPRRGRWTEAFNSDRYDNWMNPNVVGNGGAVEAWGVPVHGFETSAAITLPANGLLVFTVEE